eukprot:5555952-Pyramimonas_sp.AAC.1
MSLLGLDLMICVLVCGVCAGCGRRERPPADPSDVPQASEQMDPLCGALVYHSVRSISNIPLDIRRIFPVDRLPLAGRQSTPGLACLRIDDRCLLL